MRPVAITGLGLLTPLGVGAQASWENAVAGKSGIGPISQFDAAAFDTRIAGEVKGFDADALLGARFARTLDRFQQLGLVAGRMALEDAGLPSKLPDAIAERAGCYVGSGMGGIGTIEAAQERFRQKGRLGLMPYQLPAVLVNLLPGQLAIAHNLQGPNLSHVTACATGTHAIGEAARAIASGACDLVLAGGAEASITPLCVGGFGAMRALSTRNHAPQEASRPFDADRDGFVLGEGAGVLVLESLEAAERRGARIYALVRGYAATCDAGHITAPSGSGAERAMRQAMGDARLTERDIEHVNAHGSSTRANDAHEALCLQNVLGARAGQVPITAVKSMTGHLLGAAGSVETAFAALTLCRGVLLPTLNHHRPDEGRALDYVPHTSRQASVTSVLKNSFGFGGTNASLVLTRAS